MTFFRRPKMFLGSTLLLAVALTGCANPELEGDNVDQQDVGEEIEVTTVEEIADMVPEDFRERGTFTSSINPDVAPIKFIDSDGSIEGLVPDLLRSAATVMDLELDLQQGPFDSMVPGLESKRFDVVASIGDFEERRERIDFIDYLETGTAIMAGADFEVDEITPEELCGYTVGYARGTAQQGLLEEAAAGCEENGEEPIELTGYGDSGAGVLAVESGQADAFWGDSPQMEYNANTNPEMYKILYMEAIGPYGIGIHKDNAEFRDALQAALVHLEEIGYYGQTLERWGQTDYAMPDFPLNQGPALED